MDVTATLDAPCPPAELYPWVDDLGRYPDRRSLALRRALAARLGLTIDQIVVGNGSAELIWLLALAYLREGDSAFVLEPTFGEYRAGAELMGARVVEWRAATRRARGS